MVTREVFTVSAPVSSDKVIVEHHTMSSICDLHLSKLYLYLILKALCNIKIRRVTDIMILSQVSSKAILNVVYREQIMGFSLAYILCLNMILKRTAIIYLAT